MMSKKSILEYYRKNKLALQIVIFILLVTSILMIGLELRTRYAHRYMVINTVSFFYKRALYLNEHGSYFKEDSLSLAGQIEKEDYPPFLAYFAVASYHLTKWLHRSSFNDFFVCVPLLLYCLIFYTGLYIMMKLFSIESGLVFVSLCSIMPVAVKLTSSGYYTSEALGVFLTLISLYFLIKSEEKYYFTYLTILSSTLLVLTWQLFIVFFVVVLARLVIKIRSVTHFKRYLLILCAPFILGHIISVYIVKINYSPIYILREIYLGLIWSKTEDYAIALHRRKLSPLNFRLYLKNFGYFGIIFLLFGFIECLRSIKKPQHCISFIGGIVAFVLLCIYVKYRMIALPFLLIICSLGASYIYRGLGQILSKKH